MLGSSSKSEINFRRLRIFPMAAFPISPLICINCIPFLICRILSLAPVSCSFMVLNLVDYPYK